MQICTKKFGGHNQIIVTLHRKIKFVVKICVNVIFYSYMSAGGAAHLLSHITT